MPSLNDSRHELGEVHPCASCCQRCNSLADIQREDFRIFDNDTSVSTVSKLAVVINVSASSVAASMTTAHHLWLPYLLRCLRPADFVLLPASTCKPRSRLFAQHQPRVVQIRRRRASTHAMLLTE